MHIGSNAYYARLLSPIHVVVEPTALFNCVNHLKILPFWQGRSFVIIFIAVEQNEWSFFIEK